MISKLKKTKLNPTLLTVIMISLGVHVLALVIFGSYTLVQMALPDEAKFEEPPTVEEVEPPREVKVEIKPSPPQPEMQNLRMQQLGNIAVAEVDMDVPSIGDSFTISSGLGGLGGSGGSLLGNTRGNLGIGMSDINVFGLKSQAERVLFVIDAGKDMLVDRVGGLPSYQVIKEEISQMIRDLSPGTLFNVMFYDSSGVKLFRPELVPAGAEIAEEVAGWIEPINANANRVGLRNARRYNTQALADHILHRSLDTYHWSAVNRTMYVTQIILEQSIDAAFIITSRHSGFSRGRRVPSQEEIDRYVGEATPETEAQYREEMQEWRRVVAEANREAQERLDEENRQRQRDGLPPRIIAATDLWRAYADLRPEMEPPVRVGTIEQVPRVYFSGRDMERYFGEVIDALYGPDSAQGDRPPSINVVLFRAADGELSREEESNLRDYTRFFRGKYRVLRGFEEIRFAASEDG